MTLILDKPILIIREAFDLLDYFQNSNHSKASKTINIHNVHGKHKTFKVI